MNRTIIETFDYTFNPVTGCSKGCSYCYARGIADRFGKHLGDFPMRPDMTLAKPGETFPFGFYPTFYPHRLTEPVKVKKPSRIFVCSMADLLGDWVPREWIEQVIEATKAAPQHTYFFLTKNPGRYQEFDWPDNCWLGTTVTGNGDLWRSRILWENQGRENTWLSVEPMLSPFTRTVGSHGWYVFGAMTGSGAKNHQPSPEWFSHLVEIFKDCARPVFMKDSLADIWPGELIKELPE